MLKSILIGLDGSHFGPSVVSQGIHWARRFDARLLGLCVLDESSIRGPEPVPLGAGEFKDHRDELRLAHAKQRVDQAIHDFRVRCSEAGVPFRSQEAAGPPVDCLLREVPRHDLLLLGQRTYFLWETKDQSDDTLPGVVKNASRPVVAVPENPRAGSAVVIAYDGSLQAARTLQAFFSLGLANIVDVHLVCVDKQANLASDRLESAMEYLAVHGVSVHAHPIASTEPVAEAILRQVETLDARLLVMGAYGQPALREFFLGSVTRTVLSECTAPVFLYH